MLIRNSVIDIHDIVYTCKFICFYCLKLLSYSKRYKNCSFSYILQKIIFNIRTYHTQTKKTFNFRVILKSFKKLGSSTVKFVFKDCMICKFGFIYHNQNILYEKLNYILFSDGLSYLLIILKKSKLFKSNTLTIYSNCINIITNFHSFLIEVEFYTLINYFLYGRTEFGFIFDLFDLYGLSLFLCIDYEIFDYLIFLIL